MYYSLNYKPGNHQVLAGDGSGRVQGRRRAVPDRRRGAEERGTLNRHPGYLLQRAGPPTHPEPTSDLHTAAALGRGHLQLLPPRQQTEVTYTSTYFCS